MRKLLISLFLIINGLAFANPPGTYQPLLLSGKQCTGGTQTTSSGFLYVKFTSSGTLTCNFSATIENLVVAGGGPGGTTLGGGGGCGGVINNTSYSLTTTPITVTVGDGGIVGSNGSNSVFGTDTAIGGGKGGDNVSNGSNGGCGGGGGNGPSSGGTGSQGFNGGASAGGIGAGGGGKSAVGQSSSLGTNQNGVNGGAGQSYTTCDGLSLAVAYGGGSAGRTSPNVGGTGGPAGDGRGANYNGSVPATAGATNTGDGGGGGSVNGEAPGVGGSGIVCAKIPL